jgi:hypothetical protein
MGMTERACGHPDPRDCDLVCRIEELEAILHPVGRCVLCGGGEPYWKHDADHMFLPPTPLLDDHHGYTVVRRLRSGDKADR